MLQHLQVVFATDARLLVTAEGRVGRIGMIAVGPHAARLNGATEAIGARAVTGPDTGAETIERVIGNRQRFGIVLEGCNRHDRSKNFFLEDTHLVVALEHGRLDVIAARQIARQNIAFAAGQHFRAFLATNIEIAQDLLKLLA